MKRNKKLALAAVIAALYAALTIALAPLSFGPVQVRLAEALSALALLTPAAVPGLTIGCLIANLFGPNGILDVIFGTLASFLGAFLMYKLRSKPVTAIMCYALVNTVTVALMLKYVYSDGMSLFMNMIWVGLGEWICSFGLGMPLYKLLKKRWKDLGE